MWVLTRRRPTGPRRGTTVLVLGAMSILLGCAALTLHFWVAGTEATETTVLLTRLAALLGPLVWAAFTVAAYRDERRHGDRTYGAKAGLAILTLATLGATAAMLPGVIDSFVAIGNP
jgi:cytochrome bd-type quinol oxidase subunit 2